MKKWIVVLISFILLIIDNSLMPYLSINGAYPKLLFIFAIAYSIINGKENAVFIGIFTGVLQDVFFYNGFGINTFINLYICLLGAILGENIYREKKLIPVISSAFFYMLKILSIFAIFKLIGKSVDLKIGIYSALYSMLIMFLGYNHILRLYKFEYKENNWRFK
jgi:rod shape-determining protein MreD